MHRWCFSKSQMTNNSQLNNKPIKTFTEMTDNTQKLPTQIAQQSSNVSQHAVNFFDPAQFDTAQRMSNLFASSMLVPDTYQTQKIYNELVAKNHIEPNEAMAQAKMSAVANCMIALDISTRIGASPLMVMQNLVIIYGRPSWSSKFLISTVNTCGRFEPLKFRFTEGAMLGKFNYTDYQFANGRKQAVTKEFDGTKIANLGCVAYTTAKGSKDVLESSPITLRMAVDEGWYTKNGSKWRTMPKQMLMYRAASFWTSVYAPELSMGMRTVEETQDIAYVEAEDVTEQVEAEKAANANRETISFDDTTAVDVAAGDAPANVDTETGEIKQQEEPAAPAGPAY